MLHLLALCLLALPCVAQDPSPAKDAGSATQPQKIQVEVPLRLDAKQTIPARTPDPTKKTTERYFFSESEDKIEGVRLSSLSIHERHDSDLQIGANRDGVKLKSHFEQVLWTASCSVGADGKAATRLSFRAVGPDNALGIVVPRKAEEFSLLYRRGEVPVSLPAAEYLTRAETIVAKFDQAVHVDVGPETLLEIADAGAVRLKYPEGRRDLELREADREALRWFVHEKVPGGAKLIEQRYSLVPRKADVKKSADAPVK